MSVYVCDHCGRTAGDDAGGSASMSDASGFYRLCHPTDAARPDCFVLVTESGETIGTRKHETHDTHEKELNA